MVMPDRADQAVCGAKAERHLEGGGQLGRAAHGDQKPVGRRFENLQAQIQPLRPVPGEGVHAGRYKRTGEFQKDRYRHADSDGFGPGGFAAVRKQ